MSEDANVDAGTEVTETDAADVVTPPESNGWWQFQSKEEAAEWANGIVEKRLARERKKYEPLLQEHATLKSEIEELRPLKEATLTDSQRWESERAALTSELEELRQYKASKDRTDLVREIAEEKGLPSRFISRVRGDDADEIAADIDDLITSLEDGKPRKPASLKPKETDADERGRKGQPGGGSADDDDFSVEAILETVRKNRGTTFAH